VVLIWALGSIVVAAPLVVGMAVIAFRRRKSTPLNDDTWSALAAELARSLGLTHRVRLLLAGASTMPMAAGVLRPAVMLPRVALDWPDDKRRVVLLHELAHVRRLDCLTQALAHLALAVHWFNPLAWYAMRRLTAEREQACDDMVLSAGARPSSYADHLLHIARTLHAGPLAAAAAVPMARRSQLEGRLLGILDATRPRRAATRRMIAAGFLVTAALLLPVAALRIGHAQVKAQSAKQPADEGVFKPVVPEGKPTSDVTGVVKDESGKPVGGVEVLAVEGWKRGGERRTAKTDDKGAFRFDGLDGERYWFFSVDDERFGWQWDHERGVEVPAKPELLPVEITVHRARTLRGTVKDNDGKPVANARVVLVNQRLGGPKSQPVSGHTDIDFLVAESDAAGRFEMKRLRPGEATFVLEHPDYANTIATIDVGKAEVQDATLTIDKGLTLRGRVVHDGGKPLAGVAVRVGINEAHRPMVDWTGATDADGRFEAPHIPPRRADRWQRVMSVGASIEHAEWYADYYSVYQTGPRELPDLTIEARRKEPNKEPQPGHVDVGKSAPPKRPGQEGPTGTVTVSLPDGAGDTTVFLTSLADVERPYSEMLSGGKMKFKDVPAGRYVASALADRALPPKTIDVAEGQTATVSLEPGPCKVSGVVRAGGKPVGGGWLSWAATPRLPRAVFQGNVQVGPDGRFAIDGLTRDTYQLTHATATSFPNEFSLKLDQDDATFDIDLPPNRIEGTLVGRTPNPKEPDGVGSIQVRPRAFPPTVSPRTGFFVEAEPGGRFVIEHVPPGRYTIWGYGLATTVDVPRPDSVVAATLRPPDKTGEIAGVLKGRVPAPDSREWDSLYVTAFPKDDLGYNLLDWNAQVHEFDRRSGAFRIRGLRPGTYGVLVSGAGLDFHVPVVWLPEVTVREGLSRELPIEVPEGRHVDILLDDRRALDRSATVTPTGWRVRMPSGDWLDGSVLQGSSPSLPLGDYVIEAHYGTRGTVTQKFTVERGEGEQKVTVTPPPK
jgi:beta-lactamase regulating signal transducer with metallopeptidase domain/uncharacterized GH25 family protein